MIPRYLFFFKAICSQVCRQDTDSRIVVGWAGGWGVGGGGEAGGETGEILFKVPTCNLRLNKSWDLKHRLVIIDNDTVL